MILNIEPTQTVDAAATTLRNANLAVEHIEDDLLRVGNRFVFHVASKFWKSADGRIHGYGVRRLIETVRGNG